MYASLEDVAQDLDTVIQSRSSQGEWTWEAADEQEQEGWTDFVHDPSSKATIFGLTGKVQVMHGVYLSFSLRSGSHAHETGKCHGAVVNVSAPTLAPNQVSKLKKALIDRSREWEQEGIETLFLFDLLTTAQEFTADLADSGQLTDASQEPELPSSETNSVSQIELYRALFWSHHLKAPSKLKDFNNWCPELGIWGIVRVGYPGYLLFEGESSAVEEMVRRVKGLQWHALQLRVETKWVLQKQKEVEQRSLLKHALLSCPLAKDHPNNVVVGDGKVRTGCHVIESLGELVKRMRECGLDEEEVEGALGIRMSSASAR